MQLTNAGHAIVKRMFRGHWRGSSTKIVENEADAETLFIEGEAAL